MNGEKSILGFGCEGEAPNGGKVSGNGNRKFGMHGDVAGSDIHVGVGAALRSVCGTDNDLTILESEFLNGKLICVRI